MATEDMVKKIGPYAAVFAAVLFWGLSFIWTKVALGSFSVITLIFFRCGIASFFFILLLLYKKMYRFTWEEHKKMLVLALVQPVLYLLFENYGVKNTGAALASLIIATIPIAVLILAVLVLKEKITPLKVFGVFLSFFGIFLLVYGDTSMQTGSASFWGLLSLAMAVVCGAVYNILVRALSGSIPVAALTSYQFIYGAVMMAPFMFFQLPHIRFEDITLAAVGALLFLVVFSTIIAFLSFNYALSQIPASQASVFLNAVPAVTVIGAWIYLKETITLLQVMGGLIIVLALYLANKSEHAGAARNQTGQKPRRGSGQMTN